LLRQWFANPGEGWLLSPLGLRWIKIAQKSIYWTIDRGNTPCFERTNKKTKYFWVTWQKTLLIWDSRVEHNNRDILLSTELLIYILRSRPCCGWESERSIILIYNFLIVIILLQYIDFLPDLSFSFQSDRWAHSHIEPELANQVSWRVAPWYAHFLVNKTFSHSYFSCALLLCTKTFYLLMRKYWNIRGSAYNSLLKISPITLTTFLTGIDHIAKIPYLSAYSEILVCRLQPGRNLLQ
jgi:hypothetical protein